MAIFDRTAMIPPQKPYLSEEYLRQLARSVQLCVEFLFTIFDRVKYPVQELSSFTSDVTLDQEKSVVLADAASGDIAITLPNSADTPNGRTYSIKKIDATANAVTVSGDADIDGISSIVITSQYDSYTIVKNGGDWFII